MSNTEKDTKRPLDVEEFSETQMDGVSGGKDNSDPGNRPDRRRARLNTAYFNISDRD